MNDERSVVTRRERSPLPPRQGELPAAGLGDVARDVVDHVHVIARDALSIAKLEAAHTLDRVKARVREAAPRIVFGLVAGVTALAGVVFLLIAIFVALGGPVPSVGWRLAIFGIFFLVVSMIAAVFAGTHEKLHEEQPRRVFAEVEPTAERSTALTTTRH